MVTILLVLVYVYDLGLWLLRESFDIMCASDTVLESESKSHDDTKQSTEVDNMIDVVYEGEIDDEANF